MQKKLRTFFSRLTRETYISLWTVAISLPLLAFCLLLTFSAAFWVYDLTHQGPIFYISRRVMLALVMPGCLGSLALTGFVIYRVRRYFEVQFKEN